MKIKNRIVYVFDNKGETLDRYTVVFHSNGTLLGCNNAPFHPQGIGMFCGEVAGSTRYNKGYNRRLIDKYITEARADKNWLGIEITDVSNLPTDVVAFISQSL